MKHWIFVMNIDLEELRRRREVIDRVAGTSGVAEARSVLGRLAGEDAHLISGLSGMDGSDWEKLLETLRHADSELATGVGSAREVVRAVLKEIQSEGPFEFSSRIRAVSYSPYLDLATGGQVIRLIFKTVDGESIVSDQDLEDSLWIGAAVLDSIVESVDMMIENTGIPPERIAWGDDFGSRLALAEAATKKLRRLYNEGNRLMVESRSYVDDIC